MENVEISLSCPKCGNQVTQLPADTDLEKDVPCPVCGAALALSEESRIKLTEIARAEAIKQFSRIPGFKPR